MLRARLNNGVFILGIDAENVRRLKDGQPILVALAEMGGTDDVIIMYGDTYKDIADELRKETGKELPESKTLDELRNPQ